MASLLEGLKAAPGPKKSDPASKRAAAIEVEGLEVHCALAKIGSEITDWLKGSPVKGEMLQHFLEVGKEKGSTPDNYYGEEGKAKNVSLQLRKKDNRSALSADVVARCVDDGIRTEHYVIVPGAVIVNPKYMDKTDTLEKLLAMAKKAGFPEDFFAMQHEVSREIVSDDTLNDIFAQAKKGAISDLVARELLESVASPVAMTKWTGTLAEAMDFVSSELCPEQAPAAAKTVNLADVVNKAKGKAKANAKDDLMATMKASLAAEEAEAARK